MSFFKDASLKAESATPIYQQFYDYLRAAILVGQLKMGTRLPSTRALADELGVSRNTVLSAYDQLFAEGYLESVGGKGTFVTHTLPESLLTSQPARRGDQASAKRIHNLSQQAGTLVRTPTMPSSPLPRRPNQAFETGMPALDHFPYELWAKLLSRHANALHPNRLVYQDVAGYRPLREAIADQPTVIFDRSQAEEADLGELDLDLEEADAEPLTGEETLEPVTGEEELEPPSDEAEVLEGDAEEILEEGDAVQVLEEDGDEVEDDDVLEETPEFLRDNPDDDELWFEQGEPKDFDF